MASERLAGHDIFNMLRPDQMRTLSEVAKQIKLERGETVFRKGEPAEYVYVVLEGQVALRAPGKDGMSLMIDEARTGDLFGSCVCLQMDAYSLDSRCVSAVTLLKIEATSLQRLLQDDKVMGFAVQQLISRVYFKRYLETARKLQAVVQALPVEAT